MSLLTAVEAIGRLLSSYPTVNHVYANSHPKSGGKHRILRFSNCSRFFCNDGESRRLLWINSL